MNVTDFADAYAAANPHLADPGRAWGRCAIESMAAGWHLATDVGIPTRLIRTTGYTHPGREHWAVIAGWDPNENPGEFTVIDFTARQFDRTAPFPWVGPLVDWYDDVCDWQGDDINVEVHPVRPGETTAEWTDHYARSEEPGEPMRDGLADAVDNVDMDADLVDEVPA